MLGAVWALLVATRLTRGEEDAGRWELLLAGGTTRGRALSLVMAGLAEQAIHISSIPPVPGKFYWMNDSQVRWVARTSPSC